LKLDFFKSIYKKYMRVKMKKKGILFYSVVIATLIISSSVYSDEIHLKNGNVIETKNCWEENDLIYYEKLGVTIKIARCEAEKIVYVDNGNREEVKISDIKPCPCADQETNKGKDIDDSLSRIAEDSSFRVQANQSKSRTSRSRHSSDLDEEIKCKKQCRHQWAECRRNFKADLNHRPLDNRLAGREKDAFCRSVLQRCNNRCRM
jgi:hypothetical protein